MTDTTTPGTKTLLEEMSRAFADAHDTAIISRKESVEAAMQAAARVMLERQERDLHASLKEAGYREEEWRERNIAQTWSMRWLKLWAREHNLLDEEDGG